MKATIFTYCAAVIAIGATGCGVQYADAQPGVNDAYSESSRDDSSFGSDSADRQEYQQEQRAEREEGARIREQQERLDEQKRERKERIERKPAEPTIKQRDDR